VAPIKPTDRDDESPSDLARLVGQLWSSETGDVVVRTGGVVPDGYQVVEQYSAIPNAAKAQVLVPAGRPRLARRALLLYNGLRIPRTRIARRVLAEAIGLGAVGRAKGDQVLVCARTGRTGRHGNEPLLLEWLRQQLAVPSLAMSPGVPSAAPNSKPTALLLDDGGAPRGYLKLGWNTATRRMVRNEARVLESAAGRLPSIDTPALLHQGDWQGRRLLVTAPLPEGRPVKQPSSRLPPWHLSIEVASLSCLHQADLGASRYWADVQDRVASVAPTVDAVGLLQPVTALVAAIDRYSAARPLTFGAWHGDWVPWNMAWFGGRLTVWDWEHSSDAVPLGFDALHYVFQVAFIYRRAALADAIQSVDSRAATLHGGLGVIEASLVTSLYVLEQVLRNAESARDGGGWNQRFLDAAAPVVAARTGQTLLSADR
jgi:hypothetical protein